MKKPMKSSSIVKLGTGLFALALLLAGCSGGSSSGGGGSTTTTGVATPSKVSVVNTN